MSSGGLLRTIGNFLKHVKKPWEVRQPALEALGVLGAQGNASRDGGSSCPPFFGCAPTRQAHRTR